MQNDMNNNSNNLMSNKVVNNYQNRQNESNIATSNIINNRNLHNIDKNNNENINTNNVVSNSNIAKNSDSQNVMVKESEDFDEKTSKTFIQKLKNLKNKEILFTLVIALIAIVIYFSVGVDKASPTSLVNNKDKSSIENVLSQIDGVGNCSVVITYSNSDKIFQSNDLVQNAEIIGVVVVADGAEDIYTRLKICDALIVLLKVQNNQIKIYKSK